MKLILIFYLFLPIGSYANGIYGFDCLEQFELDKQQEATLHHLAYGNHIIDWNDEKEWSYLIDWNDEKEWSYSEQYILDHVLKSDEERGGYKWCRRNKKNKE